MPALPPSILEPLWVQFAALLPTRQVHHPLVCHRRRDEWISLGLADRLRLAVLGAYLRLFGLELEHLAVDSCITKAPCGGQTAGPSPVDRAQAGAQALQVTEAQGGIPLGAVAAAANRRDDGLLAATLDTLVVVGVPPAQPVVHLDAGYDYQPCRQVLTGRRMLGEIATRGVPAPIQASRRWPVERTPTPGATSTASCAGAPNAAGGWWRSGWRWPTPSSSVAGCFAGPGPATAGKAVRAAAHDLLAQALSRADALEQL